jgi:hypothetical protein
VSRVAWVKSSGTVLKEFCSILAMLCRGGTQYLIVEKAPGRLKSQFCGCCRNHLEVLVWSGRSIGNQSCHFVEGTVVRPCGRSRQRSRRGRAEPSEEMLVPMQRLNDSEPER